MPGVVLRPVLAWQRFTESLTPTDRLDRQATHRWTLVALLLSTITAAGAVLEISHMSQMDGQLPLINSWVAGMYLLLAAAVTLSLPRRAPFNFAARITGLIALVMSGGVLLAHALYEAFGLFPQTAEASEINLLLLVALSTATFLLTSPSRIGQSTSGWAQTFGWVLVVPGMLMLAYNNGGTVFPPLFPAHALTNENALLGLALLMALGAARPNRPPLAAPVMGNGFGFVPVSVGLMIAVPAVVRAISSYRNDGIAPATSATFSLFVSLLTIVVAMIAIDSRRLNEEAARRAAQGKSAADLEYRAKHDPLTGLINRSEIMHILDEYSAHASPGNPVSVLWCDIDNFRHINDGISHEAGDEVLIQVAEVIKTYTPTSGVISRMGSDEFLIVLPNSDSDASVEIANRITTAVRSASFGSQEYEIPIAMSVGVATAEAPTPVSVIVANADTALVRGKDQQRGGVMAFTSEMEQGITERIIMAQSLRDAIARGEFHAWGQPIVELATGSVVGYEALARWIPEGQDAIPAYKWVDVAESHGLMVEIGDLIIADAIHAASRLPSNVYVTLNASGRQLVQPNFVQSIMELLQEHKVDPRRVIIEVTEATLIDVHSIRTVNAVLATFNAIGVRVYLDDFGTGFSAVSHLSDFPVSGLKLDKSFTDHVTDTDDESRFALVRGVAQLAASLGLARVAEGVETAEQVERLAEAGWQYGQGWHFGKPAPFPTVD